MIGGTDRASAAGEYKKRENKQRGSRTRIDGIPPRHKANQTRKDQRRAAIDKPRDDAYTFNEAPIITHACTRRAPLRQCLSIWLRIPARHRHHQPNRLPRAASLFMLRPSPWMLRRTAGRQWPGRHRRP